MIWSSNDWQQLWTENCVFCWKQAWFVICWLQDKAPYRDDMSGSDDEDDHDAYLERMKAEGKDRQSGDEDDDSDSSGR